MKPADSPARSDDEALMERFCDGDEKAFEALFDRHAPAVRSYLVRLLGNAALADDLTQTTFVSLIRARGRFLRGSRFKPWLYAIATNAARDSKRRRTEQLTATGELPPTEGVEMQVRDAGMEKQVHAALNQLPDSQREAILQHRFHGISFAEIALAEGVSESAVKVRAHRGYQRLRELLQGLWP